MTALLFFLSRRRERRDRQKRVEVAMTKKTARFALFLIWASLLLIYIFMFILCGLREDISFTEAMDAALKTAYILIPILTAFASFWFVPMAAGTPAPSDDDTPIEMDRFVAMMVFTGLVHFIVLGYFLVAVVFARYDITKPNPQDTFASRVAIGHNLLVLFSSLAVLPVGFVLNRPGQVHAGQPTLGGGSGSLPTPTP